MMLLRGRCCPPAAAAIHVVLFLTHAIGSESAPQLMRRMEGNSKHDSRRGEILQVDSDLDEDRGSMLMTSGREQVDALEASDSKSGSASGIDYSVVRNGSTDKGVFIGNKYIELGFKKGTKVGSMGTEDKPDNFHGGTKKAGIGLVSNPLGFATGPDSRTNEYIGNHEAFWIGYFESNASNASNKTGHNCGSLVKTRLDGSTRVEAFVEGAVGELQVWQEISLGLDDKVARFDIRFKNIHEVDTLYKVRYMRSCNPENTVDHGGKSSTHQTRQECKNCPERAQAESAVSHVDDEYYEAAGKKTAKFLYYSEEPRARVTHGTAGSTPKHGIFDPEVWEHQQPKGAKFTGDSWMSITFQVDELLAGAYADLTFFIGVGDDNITALEHVLQQAASRFHGRCSMVTCDSGTIMRADAPVACHGDPCTQDECCIPKANCSSFMKCHKFGSYVHKDPPEEHFCGDAVCDDTEPTSGDWNDDRDLCCDLECESYTEDNCPEHRATNPCMLQDDECVEACRHFKTQEDCPTNGSATDSDDGVGGEEGDSEVVWCVWHEEQCLPKGTCTDHYYCPSPLVLKMSFPETCYGVYCNNTDCCGNPGSCSASDCPGPEIMLKSFPAKVCKKTECDEDECCQNNHSHSTNSSSSSTSTDLHSDTGGHVLFQSESGFGYGRNHHRQYEGLKDTEAGRREPYAHARNIHHENAMLKKAKDEWAQLLEEDERDDLNGTAHWWHSTTSVDIDFSVTRTAENFWGKFIGGKYIELGFRTYWQRGKMGTWMKPPGFNGRIGRYWWDRGIGMTSNAMGFGGNSQFRYCHEDNLYKGHACTGRKLWDFYLPLQSCIGYCKSWWWWNCKCVTWLNNEKWRKCRMETGETHTDRHNDAYSAITMKEWNSECTQANTLDYFMPGSPEEGFYAGYDTWYRAKNFATTVEVSKDADYSYATTTGSVGKLRVVQEMTLGIDDKWYRNDVVLENTGSTTMKNVRFMRSHDPDNDVDQGGWYSTEQEVLNCGGPPESEGEMTPCPPGGVAVSAQSRLDSYSDATGHTAKVLYYSDHEYAWAAFGNWGLAPWSVYDSRVWAPRNKAKDTDEAGTWGYESVRRPGEKVTRDSWVSICFNIPELKAGESVDLVYWTALDLLDIPQVADEVYKASDGPANQFPSCEQEDFRCIPGTIMKFDAPIACSESAGYSECKNSECCDPLQSCEEFDCSSYGDYKQTVEILHCAAAACDNTLPTEGVNADLDTCCEKGCSQFGPDTCPTTRDPYTCQVFNSECVDACRNYETVAACQEQVRCAVPQSANAGNAICTDRGDCERNNHQCTAPLVIKATLPDWCEGEVCTDEDCCGVPGVCVEADCDEDWRIKLDPAPCSTTDCTCVECCVPWPASIAAHFGKNTGLATIYDFMINCTILFPYVEMPGGDSALNLHVPEPGDKVLDLQDNTVCRISELDATKECTFMYDYNTNSVKSKDSKLCGGSADFECCLKWTVEGKIEAAKCSECLTPGAENCKWCNMIIDSVSRNMVMMPMTQGSCKETENYCGTQGNSCECIYGQDNSHNIGLVSLSEADLLQGFDSASPKDCRVRFAGIPDSKDDDTTEYDGGTQADKVVDFSGTFGVDDAIHMEHQILDTTGEGTLSAICMTHALNEEIIAPGTNFVWPSSFLDREVGQLRHSSQRAEEARQGEKKLRLLSVDEFAEEAKRGKKKLRHFSVDEFSNAVGTAMMEQLLALESAGASVTAQTLKKGVEGKIIAPGAQYQSAADHMAHMMGGGKGGGPPEGMGGFGGPPEGGPPTS